jgi:hypothetical protein
MGGATDPRRTGELLRAIEEYQALPVTRAALRFVPLVFQRPGEVRHAEWAEFDLDSATWTIPARRMKRTKAGKADGPAHIDPLATQAVAVLRELRPVTGHGRFTFPSPRTGGARGREFEPRRPGQEIQGSSAKSLLTLSSFWGPGALWCLDGVYIPHDSLAGRQAAGLLWQSRPRSRCRSRPSSGSARGLRLQVGNRSVAPRLQRADGKDRWRDEI